MTHPNPNRPQYLGMRDGDLDGKPYRAFYNPRMGPLPEVTREALLVGPLSAELLPSRSDAPRLLEAGEQEIENGYGMQEDGSMFVAIRSELPGATPTMIDWWFAWHSAEPQRYKLWHPRAHLHAEWNSPDTPEILARTYRQRYIGRMSFVDEYLGSEKAHAGIAFIAPSELGFDESALADSEQATMLCARITLTDHPVDAGYLVHHVRRVPGGAEMRSRFWIGGQNAVVRAGRFLTEIVSRVARTVAAPKLDDARNLLVHCSQEMTHLGTFLPKLYAECREIP